MNEIVVGSDVYGSDNEKIGTVQDVGANYFLVQKGFLFVRDLYLPTRAIARVDGERVYLNVPKLEAEQMAMEELPAASDPWYGTTNDAAYRSSTGMTGNDYSRTTTTTDRVTPDATAMPNRAAALDTPYPANAAGTTGRTDYVTSDTAGTTGRTGMTTDRTDYATTNTAGTMGTTGRTTDRAGENEVERVPVVEEQLKAGVRETEAGRARLVKDVTEEQQTIDVPVQREEVYITERAVNRPATEADLRALDRDIEVPLREQEVVTQKQAVVTGEVEVRKEAVTETQRVSDTVRREEVHVEGADNARVHVEGLTGAQRTRYDAMSEADRARYGRFSEAERTQYDALGPDEQRRYAADWDRRNPVQKAADAVTGRDNPNRRP
jgi:uncharacterized protein (TIGR02271 family)